MVALLLVAAAVGYLIAGLSGAALAHRLAREAAIACDGVDRVQLDGGPLGPGLPLETPGMAAIAIIVLGLALAGCGGMKAAAILQPRPAPAVTCIQSGVAWSCQ